MEINKKPRLHISFNGEQTELSGLLVSFNKETGKMLNFRGRKPECQNLDSFS